MDSIQETYRPLLEAVSFAARSHRHQVRKDGKTPYTSHVFRVCLILRHVFGIDDTAALTAAVLHDTIEDTSADFDELAEQFGPEVATWVAALSKDKRLQDDTREQAYMATLAASPWQVQVGKLADVFDNLMDSVHTGPDGRRKVLHRARSYLAALQPNLTEQAQKPFAIVKQLYSEMEAALST